MKRNIVIGGAAAFLVVVIAWFFLLYSPLGDDLKNAEGSVATEEHKAQDLQTTLNRLLAQSKNAPQQQALLRKFDQAIPQKPNEGEFFIQLDSIAASSGTGLLSLSPAPPADREHRARSASASASRAASSR